MKTDLHVCTTGELYSFRPVGAPLEERSAIFSAFRYGDGPDAVLTTYGIQGPGYFKAIVDHFDDVMVGVLCVMGYVWPRHVRIYRRALRYKATVEERFSGYPYGVNGPLMVWIEVRRLVE